MEHLRPQLTGACRQLLRPIARLLLKAGVSWKEFAEMAKASFIEVATNEFGIRGRPTNASRVALLTGINRHEVARQQELLGHAAQPAPRFLSAAQRVLSGWHQDPDFTGDGQPLLLPETGPAPSFQELCRRYGGDMPVTALLRELRLVGAVGDTDDGRLRALMRTYIQARLDPEKVLRAGSVLEDLGNTVVFDLTAPASTRLRFERRAENDSIDTRDIPAFQDFLEREGMAFLERVDDWLSRHERSAAGGTGTRVRVGVGVYHLQSEPLRGGRR